MLGNNKSENQAKPTNKMSDAILKDAFSEVGKKYGYEDVSATFISQRNFSVKWQRTFRWAEFKVSDYLLGADKETVSDLAETLFQKISGKETTYSEKVKEYVKAADFVQRNQPIYLARTRDIARTTRGDFKNLDDAFARLMKLGLVKEDKELYLTWAKKGKKLERQTGYCSSLMKVMVINSIFDDNIIPDFVLDFVVYHQYLVMTQGRSHFGTTTDYDIEEMENEYPDCMDARKWIAKMNLYL